MVECERSISLHHILSSECRDLQQQLKFGLIFNLNMLAAILDDNHY